MENPTHTIEAALLALSDRDQDHATVNNAVGFNGRDSDFGNSLAQQVRQGRNLSFKQKAAAYKMLRTYKNQLMSYGVDYDLIDPPQDTGVRVTSNLGDKFIDYDAERDTFIVTMPYSKELNERLKYFTSNNCLWDNAAKVWRVNVRVGDGLYDFGADNGFAFSVEAERKFGRSKPVAGTIQISEKGRAFIMFNGFPNAVVLNAVKRIPGRKYDGGAKLWYVDLNASNLDALDDFAEAYNLTTNGQENVQKLRDSMMKNIVGSRALDSDIAIAPEVRLELMPFQRAGVKYAIDNLRPGRGVYIADHMGLGKSLQALAIIKNKNAFPALIVVPKVVWLNWAREIKKCLGDDTSVVLLTGKNASKSTQKIVESFGAKLVRLGEKIPKADFYILNYDLLQKWAEPVGKKVGKGEVWTATGPLANIDFNAVVFDEAHMLKERKSKRTHAAVSLVKNKNLDVILCLSGTPIPNRPAELIVPIKDILNRLDEVGGWNTLWNYHCQGYSHGAKDLEGLNTKMRASFYVRRSKEEVLPELPPINWVPVDIEMADPKHYETVEADLAVWFEEKLKEDPNFLNSTSHLDDDARELLIADMAENKVAKASDMALILMQINALRQVAAREKLSTLTEWLQNWLDDSSNEEKIIVFGIHRFMNEALSEAFGAPLIYGGMDGAERYAAEDKFQNDPNCRMLICSIAAAGVGLTLTAASHIAFVEMPWRPMDLDQAVARAYGRLSDLHGVTSYLITTPSTIEESIVRLLEKKRFVINAVEDGTVVQQVVKDLIDKYRVIR